VELATVQATGQLRFGALGGCSRAFRGHRHVAVENGIEAFDPLEVSFRQLNRRKITGPERPRRARNGELLKITLGHVEPPGAARA
jgi:hypothetical protein